MTQASRNWSNNWTNSYPHGIPDKVKVYKDKKEIKQITFPPITFRQFLTGGVGYLVKILIGNQQHRQILWESRGGWEGWLQVEIYKWLKLKYDQDNNTETMQFIREAKVYDSSTAQSQKATDMVIAWKCTDGFDVLVIELKAESKGQTNTIDTAIKKDIEKMKELSVMNIVTMLNFYYNLSMNYIPNLNIAPRVISVTGMSNGHNTVVREYTNQTIQWTVNNHDNVYIL